jgi:dTDP-4-amino-4,6-dideoxygalactose transaminase
MVLRQRTDLAEIGALMIVSPFGAMVDTLAWDAFSTDTGIPVIIDAAASFDTVASLPRARARRSPIMISMHATKAFGIGEGGLILSTGDDAIHRVRQIGNFGIWGSPDGQVVGYNGKASEYHSAVGLAALDAWPDRRAELASVTQTYRRELSRLTAATLTPGYGEGWVSSYCTVRIPGDLPTIVERMTSLGVETRRWWQLGVHAQPAYRGFPRDDLRWTNDIASHALSLPFSHDLSGEEIRRIVDCLDIAIDAAS